MKRKFAKEVAVVLLIIVAIFVFLLAVFQFQGVRNSFPSLSPLFPDYGPYDVSVTIAGANIPPEIINLNSSIIRCEGDSLDYWFNVTDQDGDALDLNLIPNYFTDPTNPFYIRPDWTSAGVISTRINLLSIILNKTHAGGPNNGSRLYEERVEVTDGTASALNYTNITVIEINNPPVFLIGVQTVWTRGDDSTFYHKVSVSDPEDENEDSPDIGFNITIINSSGDRINLFNITQNGIMNFTPNESLNLTNMTLPVTYNITVCVNDSGIDNPHPNILFYCGQIGAPVSVCEDFTLTVTDENRPPNITSHYPNESILYAISTSVFYFNITDYDPDQTIPDTRWYVGGGLVEYDPGSSFDEFAFTFGCGVSGNTIITAESTDGLLEDTFNWSVSYYNDPCPVIPTPFGGGGGGITPKTLCKEKWICSDWTVCVNATAALKAGVLSGEDYRLIDEGCNAVKLFQQSCGMQKKTCFDVNECNTTVEKPDEFQSCYYTYDPNCFDGIKNCHDDACELLVDCGGPCIPCPTCSDGVQNQGERGIDCEGPCPWGCSVEKPLLERPLFWFSILILLLLFAFVIIRVVKIIQHVMEEERGED
ncbi:MAG: hypothetical protein ABIB79_04110 [archaeon]